MWDDPFYFDCVDEDLWFGSMRVRAGTLHPLALMAKRDVSATLSIPKP